MRKTLLIALLALVLAGPSLAKKEISGKKLKGNFGLGIDLVTGNCQVREMEVGAEAPPGFKLLGIYVSEKHARAAGNSAIECQGHQVEKRERGAAGAADAECRRKIKNSRSNLLGLLSRASGAYDDTLFVDCMKAQGYGGADK